MVQELGLTMVTYLLWLTPAQELGPSALKTEAEAMAVLRQREIELEAATKTASAAIEEDLDEAI